ncbi:hypothetical protein ABZ816_30955 [Actinosynnema sp. NPDC047251]|uniref:hypothetical protein n=1 Tax=Saccharothrix espanaensis TaxID=103731 RepID=UPI0002FD9269|nr:hypothetical protein [Saccharothrix espanaensis]
MRELALPGWRPPGHGDNAALLRDDVAVHRAIYRCVHIPFMEDALISCDNLAAHV